MGRISMLKKFVMSSSGEEDNRGQSDAELPFSGAGVEII